MKMENKFCTVLMLPFMSIFLSILILIVKNLILNIHGLKLEKFGRYSVDLGN